MDTMSHWWVPAGHPTVHLSSKEDAVGGPQEQRNTHALKEHVVSVVDVLEEVSVVYRFALTRVVLLFAFVFCLGLSLSVSPVPSCGFLRGGSKSEDFNRQGQFWQPTMFDFTCIELVWRLGGVMAGGGSEVERGGVGVSQTKTHTSLHSIGCGLWLAMCSLCAGDDFVAVVVSDLACWCESTVFVERDS